MRSLTKASEPRSIPGMPRVLVVEDDPPLSKMVSGYLGSHGYDTHTVGTGREAIEWIDVNSAEVILLDLGLPDMDGLEVCQRIRASFDGCILILTARGDSVDEIAGLDAGADDYVAKPVRPEALIARLRAHLRRDRRLEAEPSIRLGALRIDPSARATTIHDVEISLTTAEFDLLWFLARRAGQVVPRDTLYQELLGRPYDGLDRTIDLRVSKLRRRLGDDAANPTRLKSIRGTGYLLVR